MQKSVYFILTVLIFGASQASAADCKNRPGNAVAELKNKKNSPEERAEWGNCLFRHHFNNSEATQALTLIIRDPEEDTLLREDLIEALVGTPLRKKLKVQMAPISEVNKEEQEALAQNSRSLNAIIEITQAVKSMEEIIPASKYEGDFIKALGEVSLDENAHVLLRLAAVDALEKITETTIASGIYDSRYLKIAQESFQAIAMKDDPISHYSGLQKNYEKIASSFPKNLIAPDSGRVISSQK